METIDLYIGEDGRIYQEKDGKVIDYHVLKALADRGIVVASTDPEPNQGVMNLPPQLAAAPCVWDRRRQPPARRGSHWRRRFPAHYGDDRTQGSEDF